jgi:hypothetical protein
LPSVRDVQLCPGSIGEIYGIPRGQFRVFGAVGGQQYLLGRWLIFSASSLIWSGLCTIVDASFGRFRISRLRFRALLTRASLEPPDLDSQR